MSDELKPKTTLVIDPRGGDFEFARKVLDDVYVVMRKHNCIICSQDNRVPLVLARIEDGSGKARCIAEVRQITPEMVESRRMIWTGQIIRDPILS